jgi:hypothetical protein
MAWTEPPTFSAGTELAAADLDLLGDDLNYLKAQTDLARFTGVLVDRNGVGQTITTATPTLVSFTRETGDTDGYIAVTSTTITVPSAAIPPGFTTVIMDVRFFASWASNTTGIRRATLLVDGSDNVSSNYSAATANTTDHIVSWFVFAAAGTEFELEVEQTSGGNLSLTNASLWVTVYKPYA